MQYSPQELAQLQRSLGNKAVVGLLQGGSGHEPVIQRDWYEFGGANEVPHIHNYGKGCHLKITDPDRPGEPVRIDMVKNGKRNYENVAYAFRLARATGDTTLVDAIKSSMKGT